MFAPRFHFAVSDMADVHIQYRLRRASCMHAENELHSFAYSPGYVTEQHGS